MSYTILFSNIGYARGIDGSLQQHIGRAGRHLYCGVPAQEHVLGQVRNIMKAEKPDVCCFVEIDQGSYHSARYNQLNALRDDDYRFHDIADKYGHNSLLGRLPLHVGKSNAFLAREDLPFERLYFRHGTKRLVYRLALPDGTALYFAHFSLKKDVRAKQFREVHDLTQRETGPVVLMADFNINQGFEELRPLLENTDLTVLNREDEHTFTFHRRKLALDLCLCSRGIADRTELRIIPQPFADHHALLVRI